MKDITKEQAIKILKESRITYVAPNGRRLVEESLEVIEESIKKLSLMERVIDYYRTTDVVDSCCEHCGKKYGKKIPKYCCECGYEIKSVVDLP